ncbi:alpha/beta hydrolase family protein [Dyella japonica]|uniref:alpha/beta hydrolase family protein n=1 Tax=Dyella japonica TaxID=231455 RepID=UPI00069BB381|nr:alpha/beta fold hydrolase [Dyella japonica]
MRVSWAILGAAALLLAGRVDATSVVDTNQGCEVARAATPTVTHTTLNGVPAILRIPAHITKAPIILWHGFGPPASESAMMEALPLDDVDAVKVYLGLPLFGARAPAGGMKELARRQGEDVGLEVFKPVVAGAADELSDVVAALAQHGCMKAGSPVRVVGFSAGGAAALYAMAQGKVKIDAAVLLNPSTGLNDSVQAYEQATGRTYAWSPASRELARQTDAAAHAGDIARHLPALLFLQGANDSVLDTQAVPALCEKLKPLYGEQTSRLQCRQLTGMSHQWSADAASLAMVRKAVGAWFMDIASAPTQ